MHDGNMTIPKPVCVLLAVAGLILSPDEALSGSGADPGCHLTVAWDPYEPYSFSNGDENPVGYDIDVVTKVADMTNCSLDFIEMAWSDILAALKKGDVDVTVGTGYKPDRAAWSWYSESYRKEVIGLMIRTGTADEFSGNTLDDVFRRGLEFGKTTDDTYDVTLETLFAAYEDQVHPRVSEQENIWRLLDGSSDGFLGEGYVGAAAASRLGKEIAVEFHPLSFDAGTYRLQMSRQTIPAERLAAFNAAIQELESNGWLADRLRNYDIQTREPKH
jgi:polar amino acid transport system substrate-binding protein